ncbi:5-hydroxytryptamine receptor 1D [Biomphalaria pfeifferi]|uniref:5-hydroxytryptamine receptor 1D n=1 Tax=Biomphalaria pfeifferi TaxID=112525 RepID=A0AAD8FMG3_BIOPF|nr:5-hydroxytryptamine receptor 1D [Biomphalaria pfeifferi]
MANNSDDLINQTHTLSLNIFNGFFNVTHIPLGNISVYRPNGQANNSWDISMSSHVDLHHIPKYGEPVMVIICLLLGSMILAIILGNIFVITAILVERSLHGVSNYLILSLATTDLLVAVLVMPVSLINEVSVKWFLGAALCDMWVSMDVLCCTASILHLVAIAFDRYWAVSNIDYIRSRSAKQILFMVAVVWMVSICISIPPLFGWRHNTDGPDFSGQCLISQDYGYTIFSTLGAFYCPLVLMLIINFKIYRAARYRIRKKRFVGRTTKYHVPLPIVTMETSQRLTARNSSGSDVSQDGVSTNANDVTRLDMESPLDEPETGQPVSDYEANLTRVVHTTLTVPAHMVHLSVTRSNVLSNNNVSKRVRRGGDKERYRREKMEMRRERKAARVLGIITGAFVVCWLPFFILAVLNPLCGTMCSIPSYVVSLSLWLGYFNSLINPIIYTIFNPSFRCAFNKIFLRKFKSVHRYA